MSEITAYVALAGLVIAVAGFAFSIAQFLVGRSQRKIDVAVDLSKNYLQNRDGETNGLVIEAFRNNIEKIEPHHLSKILTQADMLEYVALLANKGRLNAAYLSSDVTRGVVVTRQAIKNLGQRFDFLRDRDQSELWKFRADAETEKIVRELRG